MNGVQCKMARAALEIGVRDLAQLASVAPSTITRLERGETLYDSTLKSVRGALEAAGIEFLPDEGRGVGVRMSPSGDRKG